ncbi:hypothetical protein J2X45_003359 [Caulobacter sp. BE264]|uniref:hypothetical protein n=1 Tax=Caulobacter sp. BE264 TaxID=2817724 RepID=UPI0028601E40|nr:hypothetical protein [Caulobacter sp. BE264]MDR7232253.1 hypothetical protein [Caulobacter sp. BE264]
MDQHVKDAIADLSAWAATAPSKFKLRKARMRDERLANAIAVVVSELKRKDQLVEDIVFVLTHPHEPADYQPTPFERASMTMRGYCHNLALVDDALYGPQLLDIGCRRTEAAMRALYQLNPVTEEPSSPDSNPTGPTRPVPFEALEAAYPGAWRQLRAEAVAVTVALGPLWIPGTAKPSEREA